MRAGAKQHSVQLNCNPTCVRELWMRSELPFIKFQSNPINKLGYPPPWHPRCNSAPRTLLQFNESITMIGFHWRLSSGKNVRHNEWHRAKTLGAVERRLRPSCISRQHGNAIYKPGQEPWLTGSLNPAESTGLPLLLLQILLQLKAGGEASASTASPSPLPSPSPSAETQQDALFGVEFNFSLTL